MDFGFEDAEYLYLYLQDNEHVYANTIFVSI